ncbi:mitochondrial distribution and morphology protein 12 [Trametes maxima]|nr:mitochondrial distribution and morphology protein 12 [Trametes maxima]
MSIDLEWNRLDSSLADTLVELINRQLASTSRPSFIGPIEVTSFDFGQNAPDVELVDMRDIYRDFLEDDDEDEDGEPSALKAAAELSDDDFEWVSRKAVRGKGFEDGPAYHHLPPHMRYGMGPGMDMLHSTPFLPARRESQRLEDAPSPTPSEHSPTPPQGPTPKPPQHPNLQLHLHITWHSNLRITLTTSLLINYPSPMFMSLPIKLSVTGLLFNGEVVVAYEGERKRVHLCRDTPSSGGTPTEADDEVPVSAAGSRSGKPLPIGQRLLPTIFIESEIGQADKHVLKNVTRVERFIQDVIRKTIEEELVFPNFQTVVLSDGDQDTLE